MLGYVSWCFYSIWSKSLHQVNSICHEYSIGRPFDMTKNHLFYRYDMSKHYNNALHHYDYNSWIILNASAFCKVYVDDSNIIRYKEIGIEFLY
jgi:hypothetical protein